MSDSYHENLGDLRGVSKREIDEMVDDPDSILSKLAKKRDIKSKVRIDRKTLKAHERINQELDEHLDGDDVDTE